MNRREAMALAMALPLAQGVWATPQNKWVAACTTSPCSKLNCGEIAPRRATYKEALKDSQAHEKATGHSSSPIEVTDY